MATIIIKNSTGSGAIPSSLFQGELAINTKDGKLFYGSGSGNIVKEFTGSGNTVSASYALTSSFAANGGVTQLLAGPNITLSPTNGKGQVTVSSTAGGGGFNTATGSYGSFYDTTTQTNPVANIPRSMSFNTTDITNGVSISGSTSPFDTYIKTENAGVYDIQFSAQVDKTDGGTDDIVIWLRKNGIDLTDTATTLTLPTNNSKVVAAWNWFVNSAANDYYQIIWYSADIDLRILAEPISGTHPGIPSVILTVNRVDQFLSNTGSFSGSFNGTFTGSLFGTASFATSASYAAQAGNSSTIDVNVFSSPVDSYLLMSNVAGTTGVAIGGDADLRYNSSTNVLTVPNISSTTFTASNATISGNVTVLGTASINTLVVNQIGYSSGSNQLGDAADDTQTLYGTVVIPTGSLTVSGSFTSILSPTDIRIQSNLSSSFSIGATHVNGFGWPSLVFSGSQAGFRSDTGGTFINGLNNGRIHIPAFGLSFPYQGATQTITTGSDFVFIGTQYTDSTAIGGSPQLNVQQTAVLSGSYGYNEYLNQIAKNYNTGESSLNIQKRNNAGETIALNLNSGNDGFSIFSTLSQPTSSFLRLVSGSSNNLIDFRYDANYIQQNTIIGSGPSTSPTSRLQVRGSGATPSTTALRVENTNASASLVVLDDGSVGVGTSTTTAKLDVRINQANTSTVSYLNLLNDAAGYVGYTFKKVGSNDLGLYGNYTTPPAMLWKYVDGVSSYVGINTASPAASLHITGSSTQTLLKIDSPASSNIINVSGSGNIGIGTATPISILTIQTSGSVQAAQPIISVVSGSTFGGWLIYTGSNERARYAWNTGDGAYIYTPSTDPFTIYTNNTRALRIDSSQNVGIGTITPAYRLDVSGSGNFATNLTVTGSTILTNGQTTIQGAGATSATTALLVRNSTPTNIITVLNNGVVGINRTPTASLDVAGTTRISGSFNTATSGSILTVIGSGSAQPIFTVQGSQGELFSITDSLSGSLFSVNDISGLPILEVFSDNTTLIGDYQDPMLITTKKVTMTNSGSFVVYSLPTASYDTAFFDYSIKSGSNARAGQIMAIQSGSSVNFTETTTTDFGSTTAVAFTVLVSGSNMVLTGSASTGSWTIKTIVRGL